MLGVVVCKCFCSRAAICKKVIELGGTIICFRQLVRVSLLQVFGGWVMGLNRFVSRKEILIDDAGWGYLLLGVVSARESWITKHNLLNVPIDLELDS